MGKLKWKKLDECNIFLLHKVAMLSNSTGPLGIRAFVLPPLKIECGVEKPTSMDVGIKKEILVDNVSPNPLRSRVEDERNEEGRNKYVEIS